MKRLRLFVKSIGYSFGLMYRSSKLLILLYLALNLLCATMPLLSAFALKYMLDIMITKKPDMITVMFYIGLYIMSLVMLQVMNSTKNIASDSVFKKSMHLYDCDLYEKLAKLPMSVIDTSEGLDMIDDVRYARNTAVFLTYRIVSIFSLLYTFCVTFGTIVTFNIWFALLFLILTVPGIILNVIFDRKAEELRLKTAPDLRKFSYYRWMLTDAWPSKDIRMYDLTEPIKERYDSEKNEYRKANKRLDLKKVITSMLSELITRSGEISFTVFVVLHALKGEISIGDVALYIGFALSATSSFQTMTSVLVMGYTRTTEIMERVFEFMDIKCPEEGGKKRKLDSFESLVFENVYFRYPLTDKYVLNGISFTLNRGDKLSVIGINGSGKSTIIKLMLGLYEIESGQIKINDYPIKDYDIKDVRRLFSVLFQSFVQYPLTLRENIALSDYDRIKSNAEITEALLQSGVYDELLSKLEHGIDSYLTRTFDDNGTELSKGQWQKIALSRVYFKKAPIVIFDEPSAALDAEAEDRIFKNFEEMSDNKTGIMISHRISSARMSNKIIVLDSGKIVETGTHDELVALGGLYAKLFNLQREKYTIKEET